MFNMASSGKTPYLTVSEVETLGFKIMVFPLFPVEAAIKAMRDVLTTLRATGDVKDIRGQCVSWDDFYETVGVARVRQVESTYARPRFQKETN